MCVGAVIAVVFHPVLSYMITAGLDNTIRIWKQSESGIMKQ